MWCIYSSSYYLYVWILRSSCSQSAGRNWSSQFGTLVSSGSSPFSHYMFLIGNLKISVCMLKNPASSRLQCWKIPNFLFPSPFCTFAIASLPCPLVGLLSCRSKIWSNKNFVLIFLFNLSCQQLLHFFLTPLVENCFHFYNLNPEFYLYLQYTSLLFSQFFSSNVILMRQTCHFACNGTSDLIMFH